MTVKEYLKSDPKINVGEVARIMFPNNKGANVYLSQKLNEKGNRKFTQKDSEKALKALMEISDEWNTLTIE